MRGTKTRRMMTAYHEAGHAVVALHFGLRIDRVLVSKDDPDSGHISYILQRGHKEPDLENPSQVIIYWSNFSVAKENRIKVMLAGVVAVSKLLGTEMQSHGAELDLQNAMELAACIGDVHQRLSNYAPLPPWREVTFLNRARRDTRKLLADPRRWKAVEVLAHDLNSWGRLSGDDVAETVQWAARPDKQMGLLV